MVPKATNRPHKSLTFDPEVLAAAVEAARTEDMPLSTWLNRLVRTHLGVTSPPVRRFNHRPLEPAGDGR